MASTYSPLKIELIGTGEQVATWGQTTNTNLGTAIEQAIGGKADVTMSSTSVTLTLTDTNALQNARALYLNLTGTPGGAATLNVPAVQKAYIVRNGTTGGFAVTVKVAGQTGVSVPNGATMHLYNNGTDVVNAMTNLPAGATVGGVAIGTGGGSVTSVTGTGNVNGITLTGTVTSSGSLTLGGTLTNVDLATQVTNTLPTNRGGTGQTVAQYCNLLTNVSGTLPIANGGTGTTSTTFCSLTTNVIGVLPVANGGTGSNTLTANSALIGNGTGAVLGLAPGASGNVMTSNGTTWTSSAAVNSFNAGTTGLTPSTSTTGAVTLGGTLNVANGGTGATTADNARTNLGLVIGTNVLAPNGNGSGLTNLSASAITGTLPVSAIGALRLITRQSVYSGAASNSVINVSLPTSLFGGNTPSFVMFDAKASADSIIDLRVYYVVSGATYNKENIVLGTGSDDTDQGAVATFYLANTFVLPYSATQQFYIGLNWLSGAYRGLDIFVVGYQV